MTSSSPQTVSRQRYLSLIKLHARRELAGVDGQITVRSHDELSAVSVCVDTTIFGERFRAHSTMRVPLDLTDHDATMRGRSMGKTVAQLARTAPERLAIEVGNRSEA